MPKQAEYPDSVDIIEVGPRDGLQNETKFVLTKDKINLVNNLSASGLKYIEVTSFVSPKSIPQLADNKAVYKEINKPNNIHFQVLVPNMHGLDDALQADVKEISIFTAASESFNQKNINCSIKESIERFKPVIEKAKIHNINIRAYISCALGCPYEGNIKPKQVIDVSLMLLEQGINEFSFGDTIGVGTPKQTNELIKNLLEILKTKQISMHFHDTYGQAIANIYTALNLQIRRFDSAVAGLGGCPYAQGATGNVATEDVLYLMHGLGIATGVDIYKIVKAGEIICKVLGRRNNSKVANALLGKN